MTTTANDGTSGNDAAADPKAPAPKPKSHNWLLGIAAVCVAPLMIIATFRGGESPSRPARITDLRQSLVNGERLDVVRVSAMSLHREYEANEVATDMRLKGKIVEISGKVTAINKNFLDAAYVALQTTNSFMDAHVYPINTDVDKVSRMRRGQHVAFRCQKMARIMGSPSGSDCVIMD